MKKYIFSILFLWIQVCFYAQQLQNQWVWINGSKNAYEKIAEFGLTGIEDAANNPSGRSFASCFTDNAGHLLMFGGAIGNVTTLNELWAFDLTTNNWTFKKGVIHNNNTAAWEFSKGVGVEHYRNMPNTRDNAQCWKDNAGNFWIFSGYVTSSGIQKNDLWKYNVQTNNWIMVREGLQNLNGNFGTKGVESPTNEPPALNYATTWTDLNGNFWLFGGELTDLNNSTSSSEVSYNALWKYNIITGNWTWMSGSNTVDAHGSYGAQGIETSSSQPGSRSNSAAWTDSSGYLWLFGGYGYGAAADNAHNDLWKYNTNTNLWTWVKGTDIATENVVTIGTENINNMPKPVGFYKKACWNDATGKFWYYDGSSNGRMWMYNPVTNAWVLKSQLVSSSVVYGTMGVPSSANTPWQRAFSNQWTGNDGNLYLLGGRKDFDVSDYNSSLWKYDTQTNQWTWIKGPGADTNIEATSQKAKVIGNAFVEVNPGFSGNYGAKWNDSEGNLWVFSTMGEGYYSPGSNNYLWKYETNANQWKFIKGNFNYPMPSNFNYYGQMGVEAEFNYPKPRTDAMSWIDNNQDLWLFGGANSNWFNDLWKFNRATNNWVWVNGTNQNSPAGNYGTMGVMSATNMPGGRYRSATWKDSSGNFWLFGGGGQTGLLNDLWKYDVGLNQWVWVKGSNLTGQTEVSAGIGVTNATNTPGSSYYGVLSWTGNNGIFWLCSKGDMWKFDGNNWTKVKSNIAISYGIIGTPTINTSPGARYKSATWVDADGNLVFFGGEDSFGDKYEDMWKYDIATNLWTWIGGRKFNIQELPANYGEMNEAFISNVPGSRSNAVSWKDNQGNFLLYGGDGWDEDGTGYLSDIWESNRNFNTISGNIKFNTNNNNCLNSTVNVVDAKINIHSTSGDKQTFTNTSGNFIEIAQSNSVTITPELPYFTFSPTSQVINFTGFGSNQMLNFCASSNGTHNDLEVTIIPINRAIPGSVTTYKIVYKNKGTTTLSGVLQFNYAANALQFGTSTLTPQSQSAGVLSWNYSNLAPFETRVITVGLTVNTPTGPNPINSGDILSFTAVISTAALDETLGNNTATLNQSVVNSLDPNDKNCLEGTIVSEALIGKYVNYVVRFENTGTANALNIVVTDVIDTAKFDVASIQPVSASHDYKMFVSDGNKVSFVFENINLPFPQSTLRYGYVVFRIKTKTTLVAGDVFANQANIYFDYNFPIITNNFETTIQSLGIKENELDKIILYPNPAKDYVMIKQEDSIQKVEIFDLNGRIIESVLTDGNVLNVANLQKGIYLVKIYCFNKFYVSKLIKK